MKLYQIFLSFLCLLQIAGCNAKKTVALTRPNSANKNSESIYDMTLTTIDGKPLKLDEFKGKKLVILNVASKCGYTDQYADWQKYYSENSDKVTVLGFPCNQFLWQESGDNDKIAQFCKLKYDVTFPMFEKTDVKGKEQNAIYKWLTDANKNGWNSKTPTWNFCKYIVDENGQLMAFYSSNVLPGDIKELKM